MFKFLNLINYLKFKFLERIIQFELAI